MPLFGGFLLIICCTCKTEKLKSKLHPNVYSQELHSYPFAVKLDKCAESCNTLNDLSNRVFVPNQAEDLNIHFLNMIAGKNESKILTKDISCKFKCRFDGEKM